MKNNATTWFSGLALSALIIGATFAIPAKAHSTPVPFTAVEGNSCDAGTVYYDCDQSDIDAFQEEFGSDYVVVGEDVCSGEPADQSVVSVLN